MDVLDPQNPSKQTVLSISNKDVQTYSPGVIQGLNDVLIKDIYPTDDGVYVLVRASKEAPTARGPGTSPAGITWTSYHYYVAKFDKNTSLSGVIELSPHFDLSRLAVFPSGDFIVTGFDRPNSTIRLLYLNSSGEVVRTLDMPAARNLNLGTAAFDSPEMVEKANRTIGAVLFTASGQGILIWARNSNLPILEVRQGGAVREVPLHLPQKFEFVNMVTSSDHWVAHFRADNTPQNSPLTQDNYVYYEIRPQDASLASKLVLSGDSPLSIACESDGKYISFKRDDNGKLVLLYATE